MQYHLIMETTSWPAEWLRGPLTIAVLAVIAAEREPTYGYRIAQALRDAGFGKIKGGTLYPILARLEAEGLIASFWGEGEGGPGRKFITLTERGCVDLQRRANHWRMFVNVSLEILRDVDDATPEPEQESS